MMLNILPQPNELLLTGMGENFVLDEDTGITKKPYLAEFLSFVKRACGVRIHKRKAEEQEEKNEIILRLTEEIENREGYRLVCADSCIYIDAKTEAGCFYALQTLKQIFLQTKGNVPPLQIADAPRFAYRGFMLDSGRYFWTVDEVKRFVDLCALHKLNVFHWHLTEDQGWRIEIKKYPLLTEKGSHRSHTNFGCVPHGGFYTQDDIREIVAYCHARFITVIPEIDMPGHMVSAIACYPELSCFNRKLPVATHWGVKHDILCAGKESTFQFVFDVLDEVLELFPDKYIHLGGDEAVKMRWELCPNCQKRMREEHLNNEEELQHYFMSRVNRYVREKGFTSMMWNYNGIDGTRCLDKDIIWQICGMDDKTNTVPEELEKGRKMFNSSSFPYYLDFPYGWVNLKMAYEFEPGLGENLFGIEAPLWTEYVPNLKRADYCTFPRLGAIAETAWSKAEDKSYERFYDGLSEYFDLLNAYDVRYATLAQCMPSKIRGTMQSLWWDRRALHWQGLHNLIDDAMVKAKAKKL